VDIVVDVSGHVEVDNVHDVRNVQASGSDGCGHQNGGAC
jgi:hypothetical protein